jgi:hypothetical protein
MPQQLETSLLLWFDKNTPIKSKHSLSLFRRRLSLFQLRKRNLSLWKSCFISEKEYVTHAELRAIFAPFLRYPLKWFVVANQASELVNA